MKRLLLKWLKAVIRYFSLETKEDKEV